MKGSFRLAAMALVSSFIVLAIPRFAESEGTASRRLYAFWGHSAATINKSLVENLLKSSLPDTEWEKKYQVNPAPEEVLSALTKSDIFYANVHVSTSGKGLEVQKDVLLSPADIRAALEGATGPKLVVVAGCGSAGSGIPESFGVTPGRKGKVFLGFGTRVVGFIADELIAKILSKWASGDQPLRAVIDGYLAPNSDLAANLYVSGDTSMRFKDLMHATTITALAINPLEMKLQVGERGRFEVSAVGPDDEILKDIPFEWTSLQPGIATVDPATGVVSAVAGGEATVKVTVRGDDATSRTAVVEVAASKAAQPGSSQLKSAKSFTVSGIAISHLSPWKAPYEDKIFAGDEIEIKVTLRPSGLGENEGYELRVEHRVGQTGSASFPVHPDLAVFTGNTPVDLIAPLKVPLDLPHGRNRNPGGSVQFTYSISWKDPLRGESKQTFQFVAIPLYDYLRACLNEAQRIRRGCSGYSDVLWLLDGEDNEFSLPVKSPDGQGAAVVRLAEAAARVHTDYDNLSRALKQIEAEVRPAIQVLDGLLKSIRELEEHIASGHVSENAIETVRKSVTASALGDVCKAELGRSLDVLRGKLDANKELQNVIVALVTQLQAGESLYNQCEYVKAINLLNNLLQAATATLATHVDLLESVGPVIVQCKDYIAKCTAALEGLRRIEGLINDAAAARDACDFQGGIALLDRVNSVSPPEGRCKSQLEARAASLYSELRDLVVEDQWVSAELATAQAHLKSCDFKSAQESAVSVRAATSESRCMEKYRKEAAKIEFEAERLARIADDIDTQLTIARLALVKNPPNKKSEIAEAVGKIKALIASSGLPNCFQEAQDDVEVLEAFIGKTPIDTMGLRTYGKSQDAGDPQDPWTAATTAAGDRAANVVTETPVPTARVADAAATTGDDQGTRDKTDWGATVANAIQSVTDAIIKSRAPGGSGADGTGGGHSGGGSGGGGDWGTGGSDTEEPNQTASEPSGPAVEEKDLFVGSWTGELTYVSSPLYDAQGNYCLYSRMDGPITFEISKTAEGYRYAERGDYVGRSTKVANSGVAFPEMVSRLSGLIESVEVESTPSGLTGTVRMQITNGCVYAYSLAATRK